MSEGAVEYAVDVVASRFLSRTLDPARLARALNERAGDGWRLSRTVTDSRRRMIVFRREAHFLIFER